MESSSVRLTDNVHVEISFILGQGNGRAGQSTQPVTLYLTILVQAIRASPSLPENVPTEGDDLQVPVEEIPTPTVVSYSKELEPPTEPEPPLLPPDLLPVQRSTPVPQVREETFLIEKAQAGLDRADELEKSIDRSNAWEGVVGRIKWVLDTLSPVAGVRVTMSLCSP
jgi:hypothetical protein